MNPTKQWSILTMALLLLNSGNLTGIIANQFCSTSIQITSHYVNSNRKSWRISPPEHLHTPLIEWFTVCLQRSNVTETANLKIQLHTIHHNTDNRKTTAHACLDLLAIYRTTRLQRLYVLPWLWHGTFQANTNPLTRLDHCLVGAFAVWNSMHDLPFVLFWLPDTLHSKTNYRPFITDAFFQHLVLMKSVTFKWLSYWHLFLNRKITYQPDLSNIEGPADIKIS